MRLIFILSPIGTIILSLVFLYANPYDPGAISLSSSTYEIFYFFLILPALLAILAYGLHSSWMKYLAFWWSLPVGLYMSIASIPSCWNLFLLFIVLYLLLPTTRSPRNDSLTDIA